MRGLVSREMVVMHGIMRVSMGRLVGMRVAVSLMVSVGMRLALTHVTPQKQATSQARNEQARDAPQPGIQTLRDDVV